MRVLFVTGEYPVMQGGVGDYTRRLSQALGALGADVHVLTHAGAGGDHLREGGAYEPSVYPTMTGTGWRLWPNVVELVRDVRPDVVHIQYQSAAYALHPAVNYLPWRLRLARPRPLVLTTFHDLRYPFLFPKAGPLRWQTVLALARGSDADVVTNETDFLRLASTDVLRKLEPIPIGSNIEQEPPPGYDRDAQRRKWGAGPGDWMLAYFGFLNANKGGETLVQALSALACAGRPVRLLMVGGKVGSSDPTNLAYLAHVEGLIDRLGMADRVRWTGFTSSEEVSANLLAADCAVLPYREGASLRHGSLMAALAHGLPIVSTEPLPAIKGSQRLFPSLRDGENALLVPPENAARLAEAVAAVMSDDALRARLGAGALALSRLFAWDTIARQHLSAYGRLAK
jgi:polysaccharide biosynthesis protein PslF